MSPGSGYTASRIHWVVDYRAAGSREKFTTCVEKFDLPVGAETLRDMLVGKGQEAHVRQVVVPARKPKSQRPLL
jgi:hypothetical protein